MLHISRHATSLTTARNVFLAATCLAFAGNGWGQLFWRTDGTSGSWTDSTWGTSSSGPFDQSWTNASDVVFSAASSLTYVTNTPIGDLSVTSGAVTITSAGTLNTAGNIRTFDIAAGASLTWTSQAVSEVSGTGFIKNGSGSWSMGANGNDYNGGFTLNDGTVIVTGNKSFGVGVLNINGGILQSSGTRNFGVSSINIGGNFSFSGTGDSVWNMPVNLGSSQRTITTSQSSGTRTFSNTISGNGGITKAGGSSLTLTGANDYTGNTTVSAGTLILSGSGSIASSAEIKVSSGATLDATGVSGGTLTVGSSQSLVGTGTVKAGTLSVAGTHGAGESAGTVGTQKVAGNLSYGATSIFEWDLNDNSNTGGFDVVERDGATGSLSVTAGAKFKVVLGTGVTLTETFWTSAKTWAWGDIFKSFGTVTTADAFVLDSQPASVYGTFSTSSAGLEWTPVPEPTSALAGLLLTAGLLRRRRKDG